MTSRHISHALGSLAHQLGILHVSALDLTFFLQHDDINRDLTLNFHPPELVAMESARAIVETSNMTGVAIIYDRTFGKKQLLSCLTVYIYTLTIQC